MIEFSFYLILTCCDVLLVQHVIFKVLSNVKTLRMLSLTNLNIDILNNHDLRR